LRLLVLGGTLFLGRAVVDAALARGHEVTLFNRGQTNPGLYPEVEHLTGDRDGDLAELRGRRFDAVVDTSGYVPRLVRASAEALSDSGHYVFVSSISVYRDYEPGFDESAPLEPLAEPTEEVGEASYGPLKVLCEEVVREVFPDRHTTIRPGLIVGPHDPTGRFTYWPVRAARGGDVLAPEDRDRLIQIVDVRDLGTWIVHAGEKGIVGEFNATGPVTPLTMGDLLETCIEVAGNGARLVWVDETFLLEQGVRPWMELPLWIPAEDNAFLEADVSRAIRAGLGFRPLAETVRDTLAWAAAGGRTRPLSSGLDVGEAGMSPGREAELLEKLATP
jgi:2'-hydroxyisoflavone reductase